MDHINCTRLRRCRSRSPLGASLELEMVHFMLSERTVPCPDGHRYEFLPGTLMTPIVGDAVGGDKIVLPCLETLNISACTESYYHDADELIGNLLRLPNLKKVRCHELTLHKPMQSWSRPCLLNLTSIVLEKCYRDPDTLEILLQSCRLLETMEHSCASSEHGCWDFNLIFPIYGNAFRSQVSTLRKLRFDTTLRYEKDMTRDPIGSLASFTKLEDIELSLIALTGRYDTSHPPPHAPNSNLVRLFAVLPRSVQVLTLLNCNGHILSILD